MAAAQYVRADNAVSIYYVGNPVHHEKINQPGVEHASVGLARFRLDGLAYLNARAGQVGEIWSKRFRLEGTELRLNFETQEQDVSERKGVSVTLLGQDGTPICISLPLRTGGISEIVAWVDRQDLRAFLGMDVKLQFSLHAASLFSFAFNP